MPAMSDVDNQSHSRGELFDFDAGLFSVNNVKYSEYVFFL